MLSRAQMHDINPINLMVLIEGERGVPLGVTVVVALGFVLCASIINSKPWTRSPAGVWSTPSHNLSKGSLGGDALLLLYRLCTFIHLAIIVADMFSYRGPVMLLFYTNWSFILEVIYFFMATIASASGFLRPQSGTVGWFGATLVMLLHVTLGACMMVDVLHWGLLWPLLKRTKDPAALAYHTSTTFSWISYNTHALNLVFIVIELMLNCIPFYPYLLGYMGLYTATYGLVAFGFYSKTGRWIYPFLNASKPWAPYMYTGMFAVHLLFFAIIYLLFTARDKLRGTDLAAVGPFNGQGTEDAAEGSKKAK